MQAVGHDCDLAILSVADDEFWNTPTSMSPLELGELPALQQVSTWHQIATFGLLTSSPHTGKH